MSFSRSNDECGRADAIAMVDFVEVFAEVRVTSNIMHLLTGHTLHIIVFRLSSRKMSRE